MHNDGDDDDGEGMVMVVIMMMVNMMMLSLFGGRIYASISPRSTLSICNSRMYLLRCIFPQMLLLMDVAVLHKLSNISHTLTHN